MNIPKIFVIYQPQVFVKFIVSGSEFSKWNDIISYENFFNVMLCYVIFGHFCDIRAPEGPGGPSSRTQDCVAHNGYCLALGIVGKSVIEVE